MLLWWQSRCSYLGIWSTTGTVSSTYWDHFQVSATLFSSFPFYIHGNPWEFRLRKETQWNKEFDPFQMSNMLSNFYRGFYYSFLIPKTVMKAESSQRISIGTLIKPTKVIWIWRLWDAHKKWYCNHSSPFHSASTFRFMCWEISI